MENKEEKTAIKEKPGRQKSFRTKILKVFLLLAIIPIGIETASSLYIIVKTRQQNISELQNLAIENTQEKINKFLNEQIKGINLVLSGRTDSEQVNTIYPTSLTEVNPDTLLNLFNKKRDKSGSSNVKDLKFVDLNGRVILSAADRDSPVSIYQYFPIDQPINTFDDSQYVLYTSLEQIAQDDEAFLTAKNGYDYISPAGPVLGIKELEIASQIKNQNNETIGVFMATLDTNHYFENVINIVNKLGTKSLAISANNLTDVSPDDLITLTKSINDEIKLLSYDTSGRLITLAKDVYLVDRDMHLLLQYLKSDDQILLTNPIRPPGNLTKNINITTNTKYEKGSLTPGSFLDSDLYLSSFECRTCTDETCKKCVEDTYILRAAYPIHDNEENLIGYYIVELDTKHLGKNLLTIKLGNSTNNIKELDPNYLYYLLKTMFTSSENAVDIKFIDKSGEVLGRYNANTTKAYPIEIKQNYWQDYFTDDTKIKIAYADVIETRKIADNASSDTSFRKAIWGYNYFGTVNFNTEIPTIKLASQIENSDKERIGVIEADIQLTQIEDMLRDMKKLGKTGYVYVVDNEGYFLASQDEEFSDYAIKTSRRLDDVNLINNVINGAVYDGFSNYTTYMNPVGNEVVFAAKPIMTPGNTEGVDWYIVSEWPKDDAFSVIDDILKLSVYIALFALILTVVLGLFFTRQIVKPIKQLSKGAHEIQGGNLDYQLEMKTNDEFELLGKQFNEMVSVLKENQKLRDEFVFISAHELRTPVTAIKGYLSMILDETFGPVPDKIKSTLDIVNGSNERLVQLVHDLLEIARSEAGKMKIDMSPFQIYDGVKLTLNELKSLSDKKGIQIDYNDDFKDTKVMADPNKLKEVLVNIIGNAIKYTLDDGAMHIWHEAKDGMLTTHIEDHGIGMSQEESEKLFSKFYRVQNDDTKKIEGTGLGLFICKEIIERMDGKIWVKSEKGKGSTFSFSLKISQNA